MAAKKRSSKKKKITITIDPDALIALADAARALGDRAIAIFIGSDDAALRRKVTKKAGKRRRAKRK